MSLIAAVVSDLTSPVSWQDEAEQQGGASKAYEMAVPSDNLSSEPERLDVTKAQIAKRLINQFVEGQKGPDVTGYRTARQEAERVDDTIGSQKTTKPWETSPVVRPVNWTRANTFSALQEWEGEILAVENEHIAVSLVDLTARKRRATEHTRIPLSEINEQDLPRLAKGRVFRWAIGYLRLKSGTKKRVSNIVFRDLPRWTQRDFSDAKADAAKLLRFLGTDGAGAEPRDAESGEG